MCVRGGRLFVCAILCGAKPARVMMMGERIERERGSEKESGRESERQKESGGKTVPMSYNVAVGSHRSCVVPPPLSSHPRSCYCLRRPSPAIKCVHRRRQYHRRRRYSTSLLDVVFTCISHYLLLSPRLLLLLLSSLFLSLRQ